MAEDRRCWCGSDELTPFDGHYLSCRHCGSLVVADFPAEDLGRVSDDDQDFYGRRYWFEHQQHLGQPDLETRSVSDLEERGLHWLRTALTYRLPPGRALELGCSHGGFVRLLTDAGFDAMGLELSPWVVDFARRTFDVPVVLGPIEDQDLEPRSFELIAAMDVLEHLKDPETTLRYCAELLSDDGVLLLQTPCRPEGKSLEELDSTGDRFIEMLLPNEHLHLFSRRAATELFTRVGLPYVTFEPAIFDHYDMFLVASRRPQERHASTKVTSTLLNRVPGRRVLTMLDLYGLAQRQTEAYEQADLDRRGRQRQIDELHELQTGSLETIASFEKEREASQQTIAALQDERLGLRDTIEELEATRADMRNTIVELEAEQTHLRQTVERLEIERTETATAIEALEDELTRSQTTADELRQAIEQIDDERNQHQQAAEGLRKDRDALEGELTERMADLERSQRDLDDLAHDRARIVEVQGRATATIEAQDGAYAGLVREVESLRRAHARDKGRLEALQEVVEEHRTSRIYRTLVKAGRWRLHDEKVARALADGTTPGDAGDRLDWRFGEATAADHETAPNPSDTSTIAIDLTALLPGGENGGAKLVATTLVRQMSRLAPERRFLLLTSERCHDELADLDSANTQRRQVHLGPDALGEILNEQPLNALLCPMTAPPFADPRVPLVCVVHDLQYQAFPDFFTSEDRALRDRDFRRAVDAAERVITVSEFVRGTVLDSSDLEPDRVVAIHNGLARRLPDVTRHRIDEVLAKHDLEKRRFLLYPANFWAHKNHRMLLVAFGRLRHRRPETDLRLVLTGATTPEPEPILAAARDMGLGDAVIYAGFVGDDELAALMRSCLALIFPSLYEGFGIPVVEAMACGRPVLASDAGSLPEVAGDVALLFDARKPEEITAAIERLLDEPELAAKLGANGPERVRAIGGAETMARAYLQVIREVESAPRRLRDGLFGVHGDGWTAPHFVVSYGNPSPLHGSKEKTAPPVPSPPSPLPPAPTQPGEGRRHPSPRSWRADAGSQRVPPLPGDGSGWAVAPPSRGLGGEGLKGRGASEPLSHREAEYRASYPPGRGDKTIELELISPPGSTAHPQTLTVTSSQGEMHQTSLAGHPTRHLHCRVPDGPGWLAFEVDPPFVPATRGINPDRRQLGLKLGACRLIGDGTEVDLLAGDDS